jgi:hypothetical protein
MSISREVTPGPFGVLDVAYQATQDLNTFVDICWVGVGWAGNAKRVSASLRRANAALRKPDTTPSPREIEKEEQLEEFVKIHCESGFPYLYCLVSLRLWSILETLAKDLVFEMLIAFPKFLQTNKTLKDLEGPLLPFLMKSPPEQAAEILKLLEEELGGSGVGRFESLLDQVGLGGKVDSLVKRSLIELQAVRNVVAHKNGVADSKFKESCPWFDVSPGTQLPISAKHYGSYNVASLWYIFEVHKRILITYPQYAPTNGATMAGLEEAQQILLAE